MREARRLALIERQALITKVARRQALRALADALAAEERSNALASRSRYLAAASAPKEGLTTGAALASRAGFTSGLEQLAATAEGSASDAARLSVWQAEVLAETEARAKRLAERESEARAALDATRTRRDLVQLASVARKLHG